MNRVQQLQEILAKEGDRVKRVVEERFADAHTTRVYLTDLKLEVSAFFRALYENGENYPVLDAFREWVKEQWSSVRVEGDMNTIGLFFHRKANNNAA